MSNSVTADALHEVASRLLEDVAFVVTKRAPAPLPRSPVSIEARLAYAGPDDGEIRLVTSSGLGARVAASMLGLEPADPEVVNRTDEAIGELLNVVTWALLAYVHGTTNVCHVGVPRVAPAASEETRQPTCAVALVTDDGESIELQIFSEQV